MILIPKSYFITLGIGEDDISEINAFDYALINAGIANYNWVSVSSILPFDAVLDKDKKLPKEGSILFFVMARMDGKRGEEIQTGIGLAICTNKNNKSYGLIIEASLIDCKESSMDRVINLKLEEMAKIREIKIIDIKTGISDRVKINKNFGTAISVVVFNDYYIYNY